MILFFKISSWAVCVIEDHDILQSNLACLSFTVVNKQKQRGTTEEKKSDALTVTQRKEEEEVWFVPTSFGFHRGKDAVSQGAKKRAYVNA